MMRDRADRVALAGALLLPTALAIVLLPVRPTFDNANIATLLVVAVVAVGGREDVSPTLESDGVGIWGPTAWDARRWGLPTKGVDVPVCGHGKLIGRFVCRPREPRSISAEQRRRAVALANQAGAALAGGR